MVQIMFKGSPGYESTDFDIVANGNTIAHESSDGVDVYLPNGNCIVIRADGSMEYWTETGGKLQFRGQFVDDGLKVI